MKKENRYAEKHIPIAAKKCVHFFKCMFNDDCDTLARAELSEMSSLTLEEMGRTRGIELDRRKTKEHLINDLYEVM